MFSLTLIFYLKLTTQIRCCIWKIPSVHCVSEVGNCKACFYLYLTSCLDALLVLPSCKSGSWRRYTCTHVLLVCKREVKELVQSGGMGGLLWSFIYGTSGSTELCMVPYCYMSYFWDLDKAGVEMCRGCFKLGWRCNLQRGGGTLFIEKAGSHFVILLYCETLLQIVLDICCKKCYQLPLHQKCNSKCSNNTSTEWAIPESFRFFTLPWKFQTKQSFTPRFFM